MFENKEKNSQQLINEEVNNYENMAFHKTSRGQAVIFFSVLFGLSILLGLLEIILIEDVLFSLVFYVPVLFFISKGSRVAIILMMIAWTLEKVFTMIYFGGAMSLVWLVIGLSILFKALKVENLRLIKRNKEDQKDNIYCSKCGNKNKKEDDFCSGCGNSLK